MKPIEPSGLGDREETTKYLDDLNSSTPFAVLGDNYYEQLRAVLNYSLRIELGSAIVEHLQPQIQVQASTTIQEQVQTQQPIEQLPAVPSDTVVTTVNNPLITIDTQILPNLSLYLLYFRHQAGANILQPKLIRIVKKSSNETLGFIHTELARYGSAEPPYVSSTGIGNIETNIQVTELIKHFETSDIRLDILYFDHSEDYNKSAIVSTSPIEHVASGDAYVYSTRSAKVEVTSISPVYLNFTVSIDLSLNEFNISRIDYRLLNEYKGRFHFPSMQTPIECYGFLGESTYLLVGHDFNHLDEYEKDENTGSWRKTYDGGSKVIAYTVRSNGIVYFRSTDETITTFYSSSYSPVLTNDDTGEFVISNSDNLYVPAMENNSYIYRFQLTNPAVTKFDSYLNAQVFQYDRLAEGFISLIELDSEAVKLVNRETGIAYTDENTNEIDITNSEIKPFISLPFFINPDSRKSKDAIIDIYINSEKLFQDKPKGKYFYFTYITMRNTYDVMSFYIPDGLTFDSPFAYMEYTKDDTMGHNGLKFVFKAYDSLQGASL